MIKRGKSLKSLFVLLLVFGIAFLFKIPTVYADSSHEFSFKFYDCDSLNESKLSDILNAAGTRVQTQASVECLGPNGDGVTPEITPTNVPGVGSVYKFEPGKVVKVGVHYVPGTVKDVGIGVKFFFDDTSYSPVHWNKYSGGTWSDKLAYTVNPDFADWYMGAGWTVTVNHPTASPNKITMAFADSSGGGTTMEDEMDIIWYYFRTLDDATTNEGLDWTFDTSKTGISLSTKAPFTVTDAKTYIEVPLSEDNTLGSLSVKNGSTTYTLTPTFTPGDENTDAYTAVVPNNITSVDISATANDAPRAILSGDTGTQSNLSVGNNQFTITVLSEAGTPKDYTVNVYRLSNNANLSALSLTNVNFGTFAAGTTSYTATVPYTTSSTTVSATVADTNKASLASGATGNKNLSVGSNPISVTVNAENCKSQYSSVPGNSCTSKTYTVTVTREEPSTISTLNDLLANGTRVKGFTPGDGTKSYTLDAVGYSTSTLNITYVKGESHETVSGDGEKTLNVGNNSFDVVVTAQDGTTKTTYTINVYRKSNNANLATLNVTSSKTGSLDKPFNANTTTYTYNTDADETSVNISYTKAHSGATVVTTPANLTGINPRTTSSVTIEVTPEDTTQVKKTYTINFAVAKSTNGKLSGITIDTEPLSGFQSDDYSYDITVPSTTESINVGATLEDDRANITGGTGVQTLDYGENEIEITVQPEDPNAAPIVYTLTVTREKENVSTLNDLLANGTRVKGFNPGDGSKTYTLDPVGYSTSTLNITYVKGESHETITGDGSKTLNVGNNSFDVVVTAHNGTDKTTYTIKVYRKSNDATLKSLSVSSDPAGTLDPAFNKNTTSYTYSVDADEDEVSISAAATHDNATIAYTGLTEGKVNPRQTSSVTIEVTPEDTTQAKKTYTITFDVAKSTNGNLSGITVDTDPITPFDPNNKNYEITVPSDTESVVIGAETEDDRSNITGGTGAQPLNYGPNTIEITVQPEDPNAEPVTYTVVVTRAYKTNADLSNLTADTVQVPNFHSGDPDGTEYNLGEVASNKSSINLVATPADSDATVTGDGTKTLATGDNTFPIVVTAQDGTTKKTYYVKVKRLNDAKNLESLTITSDPAGTWDKAFDPAETTYTYTTDPDETEVTISATVPAGSGSTITSGPGTYNPATTSEVTIVVKAEDNTEKRYVVNLVRGLSSNANLSDLTVDGTTIQGFDPNTTEYNITVPSTTNKITLDAVLADDRASFTGEGEKTLSYGPNNQFTITVVAEDNTPKVYTVNVTREYKNIDTLTDLRVDDVTVPHFSATDPDGTEYDLGKVNSDKNTIVISATLGDEDASITGIGEKTLATGDNSFPVTITAQDGVTSRTYTIKVRKKNNDSSLTGLEIIADTQGTLDPEFKPADTEYTYTSDPDEDEITIEVTVPDGADAVIVGHPDGKVNPQDGDEDVIIMVTAEDGSITNYVIHVERGKATNADLDELGVIGRELVPDFDPSEDHYEVNVPSDVDKAIITAHAADAPRASVDGTGEKTLAFGSNVYEVVVTADDTTVTKKYYVTIIRALSSNVKLDDLTVNDVTIDQFDPDTPSYDYGTVGNDVTSLNIVGIPKDENATAETSENANNLVVGENTITITVTAQNGDKGYYTVTVTREGNDDNTLKELEVEGFTLDPEFDPASDEDHFSVTVPSDTDSVVVNATPNDEDNATVTVEGNENLQPGENTITVTVKAENGEEKTYTITVTKEEEPEVDEKITSQIYTIADGMIKDVVYKTLPLGLKDNCDNDNEKLFVYDSADENEIAEDKQLGTGMIIKLIKNNRENDRDIIVVKGEVTGDGNVRVNDVVKVVSHVAGITTLQDYWFVAGDYSSDGQIKINDVVGIVNLVASE